MDKNFVNVDNLVKQRLGGGEEAERSGAWQNMRELLDKEMPQEKPVGLLYWRRMFSAIALILLVGTIGVGGYKMATSVSGNNDVANTPMASVAAPAPGTQTGAAINDNTVNNPVSATAAPGNGQQNTSADYKEGNDKQLIIANENHLTNENNIANKETNTQQANKQAAATPAANNTPANNTNARNDNSNAEKRIAKGDNPANNAPVTNDKQASNKATVTAGNRSVTVAANVPVNKGNAITTKASNKDASKSASEIAAVKNSRPSVAPAVSAVAKTNVAIKDDNKVAGNKTIATAATNKTIKTENKSGVAAANVAGKADNAKQAKPNKENKAGIAANNNNTAVKNNKQVAAKGNAKVVTANNSAVAAKSNTKEAVKNIAKTNADNKKTVNVDKMPLSGHAASAKDVAGVNTDRVINPKNEAGNNKKAADAKGVANNTGATGSQGEDKSGVAKDNTGGTSVPVFVTKTGKKIPGDKLQRLNLANAKKNRSANQMPAVNPLTSKRVIQKMALVEHLVTSPTGEKSYKLDTVSMVTLTEELGIITETKTTIPANNAHTTGNTNTTTKNKGMAPPVVLPAASTKSHTSTTSEETAPARMGNGTQTMESLTAAFNDVKYHVAGMQFASGITAGVNGTFFGPNSFKGFQFGFAGSFIFSEKVSVMAELKYFHRINNNYDINDNYYTYTPASGGYNKELQQNSYSFSALHSFEFPLAMCYTEKKFNFFAGGNFVYSFSINTGAASVADPNNIVTTTTIGNDNAPRLKEQDFNSGFGIGYLFGASYKVSPNVLIDVRNVQTLWDNSRSAGAKEVSSQLYKSPSIQISFDYRLGRNNRKD